MLISIFLTVDVDIFDKLLFCNVIVLHVVRSSCPKLDIFVSDVEVDVLLPELAEGDSQGVGPNDLEIIGELLGLEETLELFADVGEDEVLHELLDFVAGFDLAEIELFYFEVVLNLDLLVEDVVVEVGFNLEGLKGL